METAKLLIKKRNRNLIDLGDNLLINCRTSRDMSATSLKFIAFRML